MRRAKRLVAVAHYHHVAGLDLRPGPGGGGVERLRRHRLAHAHVAFLAPGGDVEEHAARREAVEVGVDRAPGGAGRSQAVLERAPVEELTVPADVAERV